VIMVHDSRLTHVLMPPSTLQAMRMVSLNLLPPSQEDQKYLSSLELILLDLLPSATSTGLQCHELINKNSLLSDSLISFSTFPDSPHRSYSLTLSSLTHSVLPLLLFLSESLCQKIFLNSLAILSSDFNLQNYFCDFSASSSSSPLQPPPQTVFGYEKIVEEIIQKCLPWKISQQLSDYSLQLRPCHGLRAPTAHISHFILVSLSLSLSLSLPSHRCPPLWPKWLWEDSNSNSHRL
jgi:hypothetical protein